MEPQPTKSAPVIDTDELKIPEEAMRLTHTSGNGMSIPIVLGVLIVLLVLILGGLYLWSTTLTPAPLPAPVATRPTAEENNEPESTTADAQVQALETVSTSDTLEAIDADIEATNLDAIDNELGAIDAELETAADTTPQPQ